MSCLQTPTTPEQLLGNRFHGTSFFEPGQYKAAVERCNNGYKSCQLHQEIFEDFANINEKYQKTVGQWLQDSVKKISQSPESGSNKKTWLDVVRAIALTAGWHGALAKNIREDVVNKMNAYRDNEFGGRAIVGSKKAKEFEKAFSKIQKSWANLLEQINQTKADLAEAQAELDRAKRTLRYCEEDVGVEQEKKETAQRSVEKREKKVKKLKDQYTKLYNEAQTSRETYRVSMTDQLEKTHEFERKRLKEYLESFKKLQALVNVAPNTDATKINQAFEDALNKHDAEADISHWNENYGSKSSLPWGVYEPPSP